MFSAIHQHESPIVIYMCPPVEPFSHFPPCPILQVITDSGFWFSMPYSKFLLAIYFTYGNAYVSMLFSQIIPPSLSHTVSKSLFSMPASLLLPRKQVHQYYLSRVHVYAFSSVTLLCPTLCEPMDCSTPGFSVFHQLPELAQTHVH